MALLLQQEGGRLAEPRLAEAADLDPPEAGDILSAFTAYLLLEAPRLDKDATFRLDDQDAEYAVEPRPCGRFPERSPLFNPLGVWHLTRSR